MGNNQSNDYIYSIPISEKKPGETAIYRSVLSQENLIAKPEQYTNNLQEAFLKSVQRYSLNKFIGTRNKLTNQYEWKSYQEVFRLSKSLGTGIIALQLSSNVQFVQGTPIKMIAVYAKNRPEWLITDYANVLYGVTTISIYENMKQLDVITVLEETQVSTLFCSIEELYQLAFYPRIGNLQNLVCFDEQIPLDLFKQLQEQRLNVYTFKAVLDKGMMVPTQAFPKIDPDNIYTFCYTINGLGTQLGAMISHRNIVSYLGALWNNSNLMPKQEDIYLSYLPLSHVFERCVSIAAMYGGAAIGFYSGDINQFTDDMQILKPTIIVGVPQIYQKLFENIYENLNEKEGLSKMITKFAFEQKMDNYRNNADTVHGFYDNLIFSKVRNSLGGCLRLGITSSAPIWPHVLEYLKIVFSIPIIEIYGLTETTGPIFATMPFDQVQGHVGGPLVNIEFKLVDVPEMNYLTDYKDEQGQEYVRGEIYVRGSNIFMGYFKKQDETSRVIEQSGWLKTGDIGELRQNGSLKIIDKCKDQFKLSQGEYVAPEKLERIYNQIPGIADIFIHGDSLHRYLVAVVVPKREYLEQMQSQNQIGGSLATLCKSSLIKSSLIKDMDRLAQQEQLLSYEYIKKIHLEPSSFSDLGLIQGSKLRRQVARIKFQKDISMLYEFD